MPAKDKTHFLKRTPEAHAAGALFYRRLAADILYWPGAGSKNPLPEPAFLCKEKNLRRKERIILFRNYNNKVYGYYYTTVFDHVRVMFIRGLQKGFKIE